jgi:uncharacterized protein YecT (DUF1311 family)
VIAALLFAVAVHPCANEQTQMALDACWGRRASAASASLHTSYAAAQSVARERGVGSALVAVQSAWATASEKTCALASVLYQGGSIQPMMEAECDATETDERVARLDAWTQRLRAAGAVTAPARASRAAAATLHRFYMRYAAQLQPRPTAQRALEASQRAWVRYRDLACAFEGGACASDLARERVGDLEGTWLGEVFWR